MNPVLLLAVAYLLGATPTSYWVGKGLYGVDLRTRGSGNLGATNTFRVLGWKAALPVVVVDIVKGWLPVWAFPRLLTTPDFGWTLAFGTAAILGHVFSVWVGFKGGKGVATSAGVFAALAPWAALVGFLVFFALVVTTRIVSLGSIGAAVVLPPTVAMTPHRGGTALVWFTSALALFVIWSHRSNLMRLLRGEENRFGAPTVVEPVEGKGSEREVAGPVAPPRTPEPSAREAREEEEA